MKKVKDGILIQLLKYFKRRSVKSWEREDYPGYTFNKVSMMFTGRPDVSIGVNDNEKQIVILVASTRKEEVCRISWQEEGIKTKLLNDSGLVFSLITSIEGRLEVMLIKQGLLESSKLVRTEADIINRVFLSVFYANCDTERKHWECAGYFMAYMNYGDKEILLGKNQNGLAIFYRKATVKLCEFSIFKQVVSVELYPGHNLVSTFIHKIKEQLEHGYTMAKSTELFKKDHTQIIEFNAPPPL